MHKISTDVFATKFPIRVFLTKFVTYSIEISVPTTIEKLPFFSCKHLAETRALVGISDILSNLPKGRFSNILLEMLAYTKECLGSGLVPSISSSSYGGTSQDDPPYEGEIESFSVLA